MDFDEVLKGAEEAADDVRVKRSKAAQEESKMDKKYRRIIEYMAKLCLSNALNIRIMMAVILISFRAPADHDYIVKSSEKIQLYIKRAKDLREEGKSGDEIHKLIGQPHATVWNAFLMVLKGRLTARASSSEPGDAPGKLEMLNTYCQKYHQLGLSAISCSVAYARTAKMWDKAYRKIQINVHPDSESQPVCALLLADLRSDKRIHELPGQAPPGDLEREIQKFLDTETEGKGR